MRFLIFLSAMLSLSACASKNFDAPTAQIDLSPVECGYKWFQSGVSPGVQQNCDVPRTEQFKVAQQALAKENAWQIARERCPSACPPRELNDPTKGEERNPDGSCRDSRLYYGAQVFFQCGI